MRVGNSVLKQHPKKGQHSIWRLSWEGAGGCLRASVRRAFCRTRTCSVLSRLVSNSWAPLGNAVFALVLRLPFHKEKADFLFISVILEQMVISPQRYHFAFHLFQSIFHYQIQILSVSFRIKLSLCKAVCLIAILDYLNKSIFQGL